MGSIISNEGSKSDNLSGAALSRLKIILKDKNISFASILKDLGQKYALFAQILLPPVAETVEIVFTSHIIRKLDVSAM